MFTTLNTAEKMLSIAIIIVAGAICGSLYYGATMMSEKIGTAPYIEPVSDAQILEKEKVQVPLTEDEKMEVLKNLKTEPSDLTKEQRLEIMKESNTNNNEAESLSTQQKLDILKNL